MSKWRNEFLEPANITDAGPDQAVTVSRSFAVGRPIQTPPTPSAAMSPLVDRVESGSRY
jgi:hypothetical protein